MRQHLSRRLVSRAQHRWMKVTPCFIWRYKFGNTDGVRIPSVSSVVWWSMTPCEMWNDPIMHFWWTKSGAQLRSVKILNNSLYITFWNIVSSQSFDYHQNTHTVDWKKHQFVPHKVLVDASGWFQNHTHHGTNLYKNKLVVVLVTNTLRSEGLQEHAPALPAPCSPSAHSSAVACYTSGPRHSLKNWFSRSWGLEAGWTCWCWVFLTNSSATKMCVLSLPSPEEFGGFTSRWLDHQDGNPSTFFPGALWQRTSTFYLHWARIAVDS